ncbi:hypothetical protein CSC3H3_21800 (plasmid) [Thalassospira marina]|uniref:Uncharacterized protein n=1 Tax=Thalassospira marina TaxID=2048283 RepID=A0ABM6QFZ6_9PROT|nr:hypothetical protein CSC3H3_21800 [Thalassospira marina]
MCNPIAAGGVMLVGVFFGVVYCGRLAMCDGRLVGGIMTLCAAAVAESRYLPSAFGRQMCIILLIKFGAQNG